MHIPASNKSKSGCFAFFVKRDILFRLLVFQATYTCGLLIYAPSVHHYRHHEIILNFVSKIIGLFVAVLVSRLAYRQQPKSACGFEANRR